MRNQRQHEPVLYGFMQNGKPPDLRGYPIGNSTQENAVIIDNFGGSSSTLMACEQKNRNCCMMELDEKTPPSFSGAALRTPGMPKACM